MQHFSKGLVFFWHVTDIQWSLDRKRFRLFKQSVAKTHCNRSFFKKRQFLKIIWGLFNLYLTGRLTEWQETVGRERERIRLEPKLLHGSPARPAELSGRSVNKLLSVISSSKTSHPPSLIHRWTPGWVSNYEIIIWPVTIITISSYRTHLILSYLIMTNQSEAE